MSPYRVVKSQGTETPFRALPIVGGARRWYQSSRLARYDFLLVFCSDVTRGIERQSQKVPKDDFGHFLSFDEHADGTDELGSYDLLLALYSHLKSVARFLRYRGPKSEGTKADFDHFRWPYGDAKYVGTTHRHSYLHNQW